MNLLSKFTYRYKFILKHWNTSILFSFYYWGFENITKKKNRILIKIDGLNVTICNYICSCWNKCAFFFKLLKSITYLFLIFVWETLYLHCILNKLWFLPSSETKYIVIYFCVLWFKVRNVCLFCWYWWNCWLSLFKLSL